MAFSFLELGAMVGTVIGSAASGYLAEHGVAGSQPGWPSAFYVFGIVGVISFLLWLPLTKSKPEDSRFVSKAELLVIQDGEGVVEQKSKVSRKTPWKTIFTSAPVLALIATKFLYLATSFVLVSKLPDYLANVLHISSTNVSLEQF